MNNNDLMFNKILNVSSLGREKDYLAFNALKSKPEIEIRNALDALLRVQEKNKTIGMEWKERIDLAVLTKANENPEILIELKVFHTIDIFDKNKRLKANENVRKDAVKLKKFIQKHGYVSTKIYVLAFVISCSNVPTRSSTIKYYDLVAEYAGKTKTHITGKILSCFGANPVILGEIAAGEAYDTEVCIHYALYEATSFHQQQINLGK